jgi:hypothetical protein
LSSFSTPASPKTTVQREARKAHDQYVDNTIFGDMKNNTKQFWSYLKSKKQDSQGVTPLRKDDGFLYSDTETKAEILNDQFHSVYTREDMTSMPEKGQSPYPDMPDIHIGEAGVLKLLNNMSPNMVLSTYWSWVFLASLCTVVFRCLYLAQSFVLFVCLALENVVLAQERSYCGIKLINPS